MLVVMIFSFCIMIFYLPLGTLFPLMTNVHFGLSAWFASMVEFSCNWNDDQCISDWNEKGMAGKIIRAQLSCVGLALTFIGSGLAPANQNGYWLFVFFCILMGGVGNLYNIPFTAYLQETVAPEKTGSGFFFVWQRDVRRHACWFITGRAFFRKAGNRTLVFDFRNFDAIL